MGTPRRLERRGLTWVDGLLWLATVAFAGLTLWFSFVKAPEAGSFPGIDKVMHATAYFSTTLAFLLAAVWRPGRGPGPFPVVGRAVPIVAIGAGILIELLQGLTATRQPELLDVLAEVVGVAAAFGIHAALRTWAGARPVAPP